MTALEEIKKAFPNMFRPLKWHHFDGPTEHGCGEWYGHATRGMYHIYDVREKFPNDRPFYAKELSEQFDTLELAQDAVQNRHELDIVMCLDPDFRSTIESLQRENEELRADVKREAELATHMANDCNDAQAEVKRLREALTVIVSEGNKPETSIHDQQRNRYSKWAIDIAHRALASTGGEHHAE